MLNLTDTTRTGAYGMGIYLQRFSIASYLKHLMPVSVPAEGVFALLTVNTEPISGCMATIGALTLTVAVQVLSSWRMRSLEISYTTE